VTQTETELIITFNHGIRFDVDSAKALISVLASEDTEFVPGEDTDLWDYLYDPVYDAAAYTITLTLLPYLGLWANLAAYGLGDKVQLSIDGTPDGDPAEMDALRDNRGFVLDGEFYGVFPTGNGVQGGDFLYHYEEGPVVLEDVPSYDWWFGCSPTAAAMLVGYYDGQGYDDLIEGDASTQTDEVNEAIASSGDGIYDGDSAIVEGTPGTGHIPDYALYDGYNDYYDSVAYTDLSQRDLLDPDPGVDPHADDCLADFMMTSWSSKGHTMGGTWSNEIGAGVEAYFAYQGYQAFYQHLEFGQFTWATLINEINHDRPVLLTVDWNGQGEAHSITVIGYDAANRQYAFYDTWSVDDPATPDVDEAIRWTDFHGLIYGDPWGIYDGIIIYAA